ncbi:MAG: PD-(D/E)XK nuclease family protein [Synechococcaceae bacterium WB8_1B_136]|nr:PD-(D/E)XK nuclease family protein [Synechococcaceae bacterium WB8_1B_136]
MPEIGLSRYPYSPQLGWSTTRSETFRGCRRRYFYQYYWKFERELPLNRILLLRQLSSAPMIIGQAVHTVLAAVLRRLLKTRDPIDQSRFQVYVGKTILRELQSCSGLMEVYYGERQPVGAADLQPSVLACMEPFLASDRYHWLQEQLADDPPFLIEPPGYGEARLQELKIYAKVDALLQTPTETVILDWKSGRQDPVKHLRQLVGYAAWAEHTLSVEAGRIRCIAAYLQPAYSEVEAQPSKAELDALATEVGGEIARMKLLCADPERNIPLEKEAFPLTENLGFCQHCAFRELCDR